MEIQELQIAERTKEFCVRIYIYIHTHNLTGVCQKPNKTHFLVYINYTPSGMNSNFTSLMKWT